MGFEWGFLRFPFAVGGLQGRFQTSGEEMPI